MYSLKSPARSELTTLREKEKQSYIALSALIDLLQGHQRHIHQYKSTMDFDRYKRATLLRTTRVHLQHKTSRRSSQENQFNVMHYQRAILTASHPNYRNMAILAALHNLTSSALTNLLSLIKKSCIRQSKELKLAQRKALQQAEAQHNQKVKKNTPPTQPLN